MITGGSDSVTHNTIVLGRADRLCAPDKKVDSVPIVEVASERERRSLWDQHLKT